MTLKEKVIVSAYTGYLMCDMSEVHKYIEELLGRPVWTHEIAIPEVQAEIQNKAREAFLNICNDKGDKQIRFKSEEDPKNVEPPIVPEYESYNSHTGAGDSEAFYRCPKCRSVFGSWSMYHQKQAMEPLHCPKCEVEFDKNWGDKL